MIKLNLKEIKKMVKNQKKNTFTITKDFFLSICKQDEDSLKMVEKIKNEE